MKNTKRQAQSLKLIIYILIPFLTIFAVCTLLASKSPAPYAASAQEYTVDDIRELLENESDSAYLELYNEDGTMQMIPEPVDAQDNNQGIPVPLATQTFNERKLLDSGKPDSESIIVTIMGDGFTATQQNDFINAATDAMDRMLGNPQKNLDGCYPFNQFKDYFTVYAIEVISNESGVSRDAATNNGVIVDNYFGSSFYYGNNTSNIARALVITNYNRARALEKPNSAMSAIICNSKRWGGTGGQFAVLSLAQNYETIMFHEFGHSFGGLADEYYYPSDGAFRGSEKPNSTSNADENTIKWKDFLGVNNVGIYPYSTDVDKNDPDFDPNSNLWFKPHLNCKMQNSSREFCPVCADELLYKLGLISDCICITFDKQEGTGGTNRVMATYGSSMPTATAPTRTGYTFQGYYSEPNGQGTQYYNANMTSANIWNVAADTTLYAYWIGNKYTVTFDKRGGTGGTDTVEATYGSPMPTATAPTRNYGVLFQGYYTEPLGKGIQYYNANMESVRNWDIAENQTLYAYWTAQSIVTLDKQGGSGGSDSVMAWYSSPMPAATAPTWTGHTFHGYFSERDGNGVQYYDENMQSVRNWDITQNYTLYAHWTANTYTLTIHYGSLGNWTQEVTYGEKFTLNYLPDYPGYDFSELYYPLGSSSKKTYVTGEIRGTMVGSEQQFYYYVDQTPVCEYDIARNVIMETNWTPMTGDLIFEIEYMDENAYEYRYYSSPVTHGQQITYTVPKIDGYKFVEWRVDHKTGTESTFSFYASLYRSDPYNHVTQKNKITLYYQKDNQCVATGTLITLADGSQKPVEELTGNEMLLVWNLYTGRFDIAPILFIDREAEAECEVIHLTFSDGTVVKIIGEHGFWDFDLNKYVYLDANAAQYIGHSFNKQTADGWTSVQLVDVTISREVTIAWSPVTYSHLCYYVNGMLSMPGGIDGLFNIFEVDAETMRYDETAMQADIAAYGLFTYEEFAELVPVSEEVFAAFNGEYLKVAIGKGLIDIPTLQRLANRYAEFFGNF